MDLRYERVCHIDGNQYTGEPTRSGYSARDLTDQPFAIGHPGSGAASRLAMHGTRLQWYKTQRVN